MSQKSKVIDLYKNGLCIAGAIGVNFQQLVHFQLINATGVVCASGGCKHQHKHRLPGYSTNTCTACMLRAPT
ncbi:uncharacterized protein LOC122505994 isoform X6 [Leptopilina heterotoma]|uniref:uncharacterized protein LOC122505994 isoform X6 n=1 Tax=Leptopilina heterotoma TaxID=63436 RepID=UPI001CA90EA3|nr:uncharacterized protein LOC122505994 isoform X6 [Leptopilina heterotoma]